jgi:hypothetical protein
MDEPNEILQYIGFDPVTGAVTPKWWRREIQPFALAFDETQTSQSGYVSLAANATLDSQFKLPHASAAPESAGGYPPFMPQSQGSGYPIGQQSWSIQENNLFNSDMGNPLLVNRIVMRDNLMQPPQSLAWPPENFPNYTLMLKDLGDKTQFMNAPVHMQLFSGWAQQPGLLSEPLFLPTRHVLVPTYYNQTNQNTTFRQFFWGQMFYLWANNLMLYPNDREILFSLARRYLARRQYVYPFWLTTEETISLTGLQTADYDALAGDDGHFEATHILGLSTSSDAFSNPAAFSWSIIDPDTNETLSNGVMDSEANTGDAYFPQELPVPLLVPAGRRLVFRVNNRINATNNIYLALRGRKIRAPFKEWEEIARELAIPGNPEQPFDTRTSRPPVRYPQENLAIGPVRR